MSKIFKHIPHPSLVYLILLLTVLIVSWIGSVYEVTSNLLDYQGMRWFLRSAGTCINDAPVADSLLLLMGLGILSGSGLQDALRSLFADRKSLSYRKRYALILSLIPLVLLLFMVFSGLFLGNRVLLGITGGLEDSPFLMAGFFFVFLLLALPSVTFGLASGNFQKGSDIVAALCVLLKCTPSYLITLYVASLLLCCVDYCGLASLVGLGDAGMKMVSIVIYWLPLALILIDNKRK